LPVILTLVLWWASTGVILYLDGRASRTFGWSAVGATALLALALWVLAKTSGQTTPIAALAAFACGLMAWAWQLVMFYMGFLTGPRKTAIGPDCVGWRRFVEAVRASLYHELAAILGIIVMFGLTMGQPNKIGFWTYLILWWMHQSAKLNVFFGVPNLGEHMLPEHLGYTVSFMRRRAMNLFFPVSITVSTVVTAALAQGALAATATPFEAAGYAMLTTLMALAIAEHWFLVLPLDGNALWSWSGRGARKVAATPRAATLYGSGAMESWSPEPPATCDESRLHRVLESIGTGAYGEVDCVRGVVKTRADWVCFEWTGRSGSMSPLAPQRPREPLVIAMGRRFDRARLQAAFDGCAALT
jgi:putative photosynthetic complex assembly protein 2